MTKVGTDKVYRITEIVGSSGESIEAAIANGIARVSQTVRNVEWFEVTETRGAVGDGGAITYQVGLKVGFRLDS